MVKKKEKKSKKTTMADVAAAVGVSKTTVSRYLHGDYEFMSEETRKKIETVIEDLNYRPNRAAQNLKSDKSNCIGLTIADIGNPFSSLLIKGVQSECRKRGCQLLIADADNSIIQENKNIESFFNEQTDGMIINSVGNNQEFIQKTCRSEENKPIILLDRTYHPFQMGQTAAALLFERIDEKAEKDVVYQEIKADICRYNSTHLK